MAERSIEQVLAAHAAGLLAQDWVLGVAQGLCQGEPCIRVFVTEAAASRLRLPARIEGYPVRVEVSDAFVAFGDPP